MSPSQKQNMSFPEFLGEYSLPRRATRAAIKAGLIPCTKLTAKTWIFNRAAVDAALAKITLN
jgi:hypothetical protein